MERQAEVVAGMTRAREERGARAAAAAEAAAGCSGVGDPWRQLRVEAMAPTQGTTHREHTKNCNSTMIVQVRGKADKREENAASGAADEAG